MTTCIICGELAEFQVPVGDYKCFSVCAEHLYPAWRIDMYLALEDLGIAIMESRAYMGMSHFVDALAGLFSRAGKKQ